MRFPLRFTGMIQTTTGVETGSQTRLIQQVPFESLERTLAHPHCMRRRADSLFRFCCSNLETDRSEQSRWQQLGVGTIWRLRSVRVGCRSRLLVADQAVRPEVCHVIAT